MSFIKPEDIANRCLQHLGQPRITSFSDFTMQATETSFVYDKVRRAELRRSVWNCAAVRSVLRAKTATSVRLVFPTYSASTAYVSGDIVQDSTGYPWIATSSATGVTPGTSGYNPVWVPYRGTPTADTYSGTANYIPGDVVVNASVVYLCIAPSTGNAPPNTSFWHPPQGATTTALVTLTPGGYDRITLAARTAFVLPTNFMRLAAQDAKQPGTSRLSVTAGQKWNDWEVEGGVLYSATQTIPLVLRFIGDLQDVTSMDDMLCEGIGARMAMELCERFTGSKDKMADIKDAYDTAIFSARAMSAIEAGSTEDDFSNPQPAPAGQQR